MLRKYTYLTFAIPLSVAVSAACYAQEKRISPLDGLYECAKIEIDADRLSCFDGVAASLQIKEEKKEIVALDAESAKTIKKEAFGFRLPSLPKLGLPKIGADSDIESITEPVKSVKPHGDKHLIRLVNGQIWQVTRGRIKKIPKGDLTATIKPGSLGSFRLNLTNGDKTIRGLGVKRIR